MFRKIYFYFHVAVKCRLCLKKCSRYRLVKNKGWSWKETYEAWLKDGSPLSWKLNNRGE